MQVEKTVTVKVMTTDGKEVKQGDAVLFMAGEKTLSGVFMGINAKTGVWEFNGFGPYVQDKFSVHPKAINSMYKFKSFEVEK